MDCKRKRRLPTSMTLFVTDNNILRARCIVEPGISAILEADACSLRLACLSVCASMFVRQRPGYPD